MLKRTVFFITVLSFVLLTNTTHAQPYLQTHGGISAEVLIQDSLITGCVTASDVTTNHPDAAFGAFTNDNPDFPFESGIIMATGDIANAEGPNNSGSTGSTLGSGSDPDLDDLISYDINDATVIEFDFVPASDTIRFNYIFGSEEFPEFANTNYNDVFGFFISGPGINGPYSDNA
ncbi:MAG: choice-of-anchor L domain-containing protein, partial [Bacteroidota bacterium]